MSLSSSLSIALGGLNTTTTLLQLTSNNISNAQTPGYTEKTATVSSSALSDGSGGVEITGYNRATNNVLQQSYNAANANSSYLGTQYGYMQQVQTILDSTANNPALSDAIAQFSSAWTQLQASPEDPNVQEAVVQAGNTLATQINTVAAGVSTSKTQIGQDTQSTVVQLNSDLKSVYNLNQQIFAATGNNQPTGNLEDQRDQLITQISAIANVTAFPRGQGQIALYTPDGVALLDGVPDTFTDTAGVITNSSGLNVTNDLNGGSLQAEIQFNGDGGGNTKFLAGRQYDPEIAGAAGRYRQGVHDKFCRTAADFRQCLQSSEYVGCRFLYRHRQRSQHLCGQCILDHRSDRHSRKQMSRTWRRRFPTTTISPTPAPASRYRAAPTPASSPTCFPASSRRPMRSARKARRRRRHRAITSKVCRTRPESMLMTSWSI